MRAVTHAAKAAEVFGKESLQLYNVSRYKTLKSIEYLEAILDRYPGHSVMALGDGAKTLPRELWLIIFEQLEVLCRNTSGDEFWLAQPVGMRHTGLGTVLRCRRAGMVNVVKKCGDLDSVLEVGLNADWADSPKWFNRDIVHADCGGGGFDDNDGTRPSWKVPDLWLYDGPSGLLNICLPNQPPRRGRSGFNLLFCELTAPDVIARVENGLCTLCDGSRLMYPTTTGSWAKWFRAHLSMVHRLACPLCMGVDLSETHYSLVCRLRPQKLETNKPWAKKAKERWTAKVSGRLWYLSYPRKLLVG